MTIDLLCSVNSPRYADLCLRYWTQDLDGRWAESLDTISLSFGLTPSQLERIASENSAAYMRSIRCTVCNAPQFARSRSEFESLFGCADALPAVCQQAACQLAIAPLNPAATARSLDEQLDLIADTLQRARRNQAPVDYRKLPFLETFYLYCMVSAAGEHWCDNQLPAAVAYPGKLAPTRLLAESAYASLRRLGVLIPSVHSSISAFHITFAKLSPIAFNSSRVRWTMAEDQTGLSQDDLLVALRATVDSSEPAERAQLREALIQHECVSELASSLEFMGITLDFPQEAELLAAVSHCLGVVSVGSLRGVYKQVLLNNSFRRALQKAEPCRRVPLVADAITKFVDDRLAAIASPNILSAGADSRLLESEALISQIFCERFL